MSTHRKKIQNVEGQAITLRGNDIDTDRIIPARFLKEITFTRMGEYPFFDERYTADGSLKDHPFNDLKRQDASILVVNDNFGCGSSREHAPQSLGRWGIKAIIAESLAEIFAGNCGMIGLVAVTMSPEAIGELQDLLEKDYRLTVSINLKERLISCDGKTWKAKLPESRRKALMEGTWNSTALLLEKLPRAKKTAGALPYMENFNS